ncbi:MAG: hypothetical protein JO100_16660 [Pseudonocardia sp.]|nr:hypothetical protein [Pseudonocardia sp.]
MGQVYLQAEVAEDGADEAWLGSIGSQLMRELRDHDVSVTRSETSAPPRAKSAAVESVSTLMIAAASSPVATVIANVLMNWLLRGRERKVRLTIGESSIEMSSSTVQQQQMIVSSWLEAHLQDRDTTCEP